MTRSERNRFIVVGQQRSGTTHTQLHLLHHPRVAGPRTEIKFKPLFTDGISTYTTNHIWSDKEYASAFRRLFDAIACVDATEDTDWIGIKIALSNIRQSDTFHRTIARCLPDVRIVHTTRRDILSQYCSLLRANLTGEYYTNRMSTLDVEITIDESRFLNYCRKHAFIEAKLRELGTNHHYLEYSYEKDIKDNNNTGKLYDFLGLCPVKPAHGLSSKISPHPKEYVTNYHDIRDVYVDFIERRETASSERRLREALYDFYT